LFHLSLTDNVRARYALDTEPAPGLLLQEAEEPFTAKVYQLLVDVTSLANGNERNGLFFASG